MRIRREDLWVGLLSEIGICLLKVFAFPNTPGYFCLWAVFSVFCLGLAAVSWNRCWRKRRRGRVRPSVPSRFRQRIFSFCHLECALRGTSYRRVFRARGQA